MAVPNEVIVIGAVVVGSVMKLIARRPETAVAPTVDVIEIDVTALNSTSLAETETAATAERSIVGVPVPVA